MPRRAATRGAARPGRRHVVDQEAKMVKTHETPAELACRLLGLVVQQREIDHAVAEVNTARVFPVRLSDLLQPERLHVELGGLPGIWNCDRDVAQLGHGFSPKARRAGI